MRAFEELLASDKTGQLVDASGKNFCYQPQPAYPDEIESWSRMMHLAFWMDAITQGGGQIPIRRLNFYGSERCEATERLNQSSHTVASSVAKPDL
jgi:hypothetical protein